jgi:hypothetical protein
LYFILRPSRRHDIPVQLAGIGLAISLLAVPTALAWLASETQSASLFFRRYLASSLPAPILLTALASVAFAATWQRTLACLLAAAGSLFTSGMLEQFRHDGRWLADRKQDWRGAVAFVNEHSRVEGGLVIAVRSGFLEADQLREPHPSLLDEYCLAPVSGIYQLEMPASPLPNQNPGQLDVIPPRQLAEAAEVWCIFNGGPASRIRFENAVLRRLRGIDRRFELIHRRQFGELLVIAASRERRS